MANGCSPIEFMDGGTLTNVHIFNSEFVNGYITNSILSNVKLTDNITIDDAAAQALVSQICGLIKECVAPLVEVITTTGAPKDTISGELPTTVIGDDRTKLLGAPIIWIEMGGYIVPAYKKA